MTWWKSGSNWMWATWAGDAQVVYLAESDDMDEGRWIVRKKVSGAANPKGHVIGTSHDLERAKALAELDAGQPL